MRLIHVLVGAVFVIALLAIRPVSAQQYIDGNPTCEDLGYITIVRVDAADIPGVYASIVVNSVDLLTISWLNTEPAVPVRLVIVKAGPGANLYYYDVTVPFDTVVTPNNPGGQQAGLSHIDFCTLQETSTPTPTPTNTPEPTPTNTPTPTPVTPDPTPTNTPTPTPVTPEPTPTNTPTPTPVTPDPTPTNTPTPTPVTPTASVTPTDPAMTPTVPPAATPTDPAMTPTVPPTATTTATPTDPAVTPTDPPVSGLPSTGSGGFQTGVWLLTVAAIMMLGFSAVASRRRT